MSSQPTAQRSGHVSLLHLACGWKPSYNNLPQFLRRASMENGSGLGKPAIRPETSPAPPPHSKKRVTQKPQKPPTISVPQFPENRPKPSHPPPLKIDHDVPLPNIVAWAPTQMSVPLAATTRSAAQLTLPNLPVALV